MSWLSDIKLLLNDIEERTNLGDSTSKFTITKSDDNITYTYASGTKPDFSNLMVGLRLCINGEEFSSVNNIERALIKGFSLEYFVVENSSGTAEADKKLGTGYLQLLTQNVSDEQYLKWANQAIATVNRLTGQSYAALTVDDDITDQLLLEVVNEWVQCKYGKKKASAIADGFLYRDGMNTVDKRKSTEQIYAAANIHCSAYDEALQDLLASLGVSSTFSTGQMIRS